MMTNPLRDWRTLNKKRALDVALAVGVSERSVLAWEGGAFKPSNEHIDQLANLMKWEPSALRMRWYKWLHAED